MKITEKNKPAAFKDNVYKMFLRYAILPAFSVIFAGLLLIFGLLRYTAIDSSQKLNKSLSSELSYVISSYEEELNTLASQPALVTKPIDTATRVKIFESLYRRSNQLGYHINVYLFDKEMALVLDNANKNLTVVLQRDAAVNWGVFRQMNAEPESIALRVVQDTDKRSARLYLGRTVLDENGIIGYALFTIDSEELRLLLAGIPAQTIITDSFGWVYAANNFDFVDNLSRMSREYESREGYLNLNGADYYLTGSKIMNGELSVYTVTDVTSLFTAFTWAGLSLVLIFILILFNLVKGASRVADESTGDINIIFAAFEQVKAGNLDNYIFIGSSLEFQAIGEAYNHMIDSLKEQIEKNKEMIEHTAYAQIKQLESQINPHFLFNTLETIRVMGKIDQSVADKIIVNLSSILRYSISNMEEDVTVRQDMAITQSYLSILKTRFNKRFTYSLQISEDILACTIPKLLIQPLIENAVKHGFGDQEILNMNIKGYRDGDCLIFVCQDDGAGINADTLRDLQFTLTRPQNPGEHLGIYNIHKRINLKYKGNYGISIDSKAGEGTTLTIALPAKAKDRERDMEDA